MTNFVPACPLSPFGPPYTNMPAPFSAMSGVARPARTSASIELRGADRLHHVVFLRELIVAPEALLLAIAERVLDILPQIRLPNGYPFGRAIRGGNGIR